MKRAIGTGVKPPAVILAQGTSRRMGCDKALVQLDGEPLVVHVADSLAPQCWALALNALAVLGQLAEVIGAELIGEEPFAGMGPLGGIRAGLVWARTNWPGSSHLLVAPVDMPFLPDDLVERLSEGLKQDEAAIAAAPDGSLVPVLGLWPLSALEPIEQVLIGGGGGRSVRAALDRIAWHSVEFPADALTDIDDPAALAAAEVRIAAAQTGP